MNHPIGSAVLERPAEPGPERPARRSTPLWLAHLVALTVGLLGLVCAVSLPFAPVWSDRTEVRWPSVHAGTPDAPGTGTTLDAGLQSTTALFAPYRPAEFHAAVPCATLRIADGTVLSTLPPGSDREGMVVAARDGEPRLLLGQREVELPPLSGDCTLTVNADSRQTVITAGPSTTTLPGVAAPEIFTFSTDLEPMQAATLSVTARTFSWFDTTPTEQKRGLITGALLMAVLSLLFLVVTAPPAMSALRGAARPRTWLLLPVDAAVLGILAWWLVIGPISDDDGFAMMTVRNFEPTGDIANYYRWFNASETPFTLVQHTMRWFADHSLAPVWLRLPSVLAGGLTWLVLSRGVVGPLCGPGSRLRAHLLAAVFFLACWLPFDLGVRPEAFVALGTTVLVAALLKAEHSAGPFAWLGVAAVAAGLTVAVTPSGVAALIIVLLFSPRIARLVVRPGVVPAWLSIPARTALITCAGSVGLVAMFADSTWNGVAQATWLHNEFGPSLGWYQEFNRYNVLLGTTHWGAAGKRLAVFLVVTAVLIAAGCVLRGVHRSTRMPDVALLLGAVAAIFAALWLTPSKWTHHFGSLAGLGPALLAVTVVMLTRVRARREARVLGVCGALAASLAAGLAFMGPNAWYLYSDIAMPWSDTPVEPLDQPVLWLAVGVAAGLAGFAVVLLSRRGDSEARQAWTAMPSSVMALAALASTIVLLGSFTTAYREMGDRFSVARTNWRSVTATSCGVEHEVETLPLAATLRALPGAPESDGFALSGSPPPEPDLDPESRKDGELQPQEDVPPVWDSREGGPQNTGSLTTEWFELPALEPDQVLAIWVAGRPEQGNSLVVEFGTPTGDVVRELRDPPPTELPFDDPRHGRPVDWRDFRPWRVMTVEVPTGARTVRLHAEDRTTDEQGWLAVSAPVVRDVVPLPEVLDAQGPTLVDWPMGLLFPCRIDYPRVSGGTADSPGVLVAPPAGEASMAYDPGLGGVFAGVPMQSRRIELPSRLRDAPGVRWGHVYAVSYDIERDVYDRQVSRVQIGGADGDGAYPFEEH
ncbi:arabinosyltransferase domain-containing protein [Saccharopolyspora erythraea]|uniref:arabinosyltransferase domain-containing protein n=1 Tax=Saccharopolyspora erythraea TaxID=1836 RepID=UPI001BA844DA|nr:arabinosyltransferase domain-containing protein [Saccharopolyspora erythraea]QUG99548.1 arabinosyltransferase domain-containing protein [Saccharopolyspora erythraea]